MMQQTVASFSASRHSDPADSGSHVSFNTSRLVNASAAVTPGVLYTLLHHTATPSSLSSSSASSALSAATAVTRIHVNGIGLISDYSRNWNATGESSASSAITCLSTCAHDVSDSF